jgi:TIR domain
MTPADKRAMDSRRRLIENGFEFLKRRPGFARAQAQSIRKQTEWESGLSEQEKQLATPQRLVAVLRLIDIRAQVYLPLVNDLPSQEAYAAVVNGIMDQAWEDYVGFSVYFAAPMREDPNYKMITDRGRHWVATSYDRADTVEAVANQTATPTTETSEGTTVFVSYSWDDDQHKEWVLNLASRLRDDGIDAVIDQTHLDPGGDTPEFMERSIRDSRFVLVVCTEPYKERFDRRRGGAGYEGHIMTAQIVKKAGVNKFIPILRRGTWDSAMPTALEGLFGADLSKDSDAEYKKLVKHLHGVKSIRPLGPRPRWLEEETTASPSVEQIAEGGVLSSDDLTLLHGKSTFSLDIWLKNHTLAPMDGCSFSLVNLQKFSDRHHEFQKNVFTPMEMIKAQTILADGTTNEAIPLAGFQNTNKKTLLIFRTFPFESACILMAEILVEGGGKKRTDTKFISWKPGEDPEFVDDPRAEKPDRSSSFTFVAPIQYSEQRKNLPESAIIKKIWKLPRWCICSRPEEFRRARFRDLNHCAQFVASASVRSGTQWSPYPWVQTSEETGAESIASEVELEDNLIKHLERWVIFRSGQFVHNLALDDMAALSGKTHVLEILSTTTALFEFIGRMADRKIVSGRTAISFEFHKVEGRQLTWPKDALQTDDFVDRRSSWCQEEAFTIDDLYSSADLVDRRRELALEAALGIYSRFGWNDPPVEELRKMQQEKFGSPIHL